MPRVSQEVLDAMFEENVLNWRELEEELLGITDLEQAVQEAVTAPKKKKKNRPKKQLTAMAHILITIFVASVVLISMTFSIKSVNYFPLTLLYSINVVLSICIALFGGVFLLDEEQTVKDIGWIKMSIAVILPAFYLPYVLIPVIIRELPSFLFEDVKNE